MLSETKERVGIYLRVSTEEQANRQTSIETQRDICRRKAQDLFGPEVSITELVDDGVSGQLGLRRTPEQTQGFRPALTALCEAIAAGEIDVLIVQDQDRLARDEYFMLELRNEYLLKYGVRLFDGRGEVDITSPEGQLMQSIVSSVAAFYPRQTARKVKEAHAKRKRDGYSMVGNCYGWRWESRDQVERGGRRGIERVAEEGVWVVKIKDWYLSGWGMGKICRELNAQSVPSKTGGQWWESMISRVLHEPAHAGLVFVSEDEGFIQGHHYAQRYYEPEEFHEIQKILERRSLRHGHADLSPFILSGTAVCGECGRRLISTTDRWNRYYICKASDGRGGTLCSRPHCRADHLEELVIRHIRELAGSGEMQNLLGEEVETALGKQEASLRSQITLHEKALERIRVARDKAFELSVQGQMSNEEYGQRSKQLDTEELGGKEQLQQTQQLIEDKAVREAQVARVRETLARFEDSWETLTPDERRRVVEVLIEKVAISEDELGTLATVKPFFGPDFSEVIPGERTVGRAHFGPGSLTTRQLAVLHLVDQGLTTKQIAERLGTYTSTVLTHEKHARDRLQVSTTEDAVVAARPLMEKLYAYLPLDGRDGEPRGDLTLSPQQQNVVRLLAKPDLAYEDIAREMGLSVGTVKYHGEQVYAKLGVHTRADAIAKARRLGYLSERELPANERLPELK